MTRGSPGRTCGDFGVVLWRVQQDGHEEGGQDVQGGVDVTLQDGGTHAKYLGEGGEGCYL